MGLLDAVFGDGSNSSVTDSESESTGNSEESAQRKYAILLNAGPDSTPVAANAFNYAIELDRTDYEVQVFLDGKATQWPAEFAENPDRPFNHDWETVQENGLLAGACGYCANAMGVADACEVSGIRLLSDADEHAPAIAQLAAEEYEILTVG